MSKVYHRGFESELPKPAANEVWTSSEGVEYIIFTNRKSGKTTVAFKTAVNYCGNFVRAYTTDLSEDKSNGTLDGQKCHWVEMRSDDFAEKFTRKREGER